MDYGPRYKLFTFLSVNQNKLEIILKKNSVLTLYLLVLSTGRLEEGEKVDVGGGGGGGGYGRKWCQTLTPAGLNASSARPNIACSTETVICPLLVFAYFINVAWILQFRTFVQIWNEKVVYIALSMAIFLKFATGQWDAPGWSYRRDFLLCQPWRN